jgi:alpha-tubulin suppressor-like RCC1 family protein
LLSDVQGIISSIENVVAVAAGSEHSLALRNDGTVWAWGDNKQGQLSGSPSQGTPIPFAVSGLSNIREISAGSGFVVVRDSSQAIWVWGINYDGQLGNGGTQGSSTPLKVVF